jgi:predicted DNA-binding protein with PD1-like motif
MRRFFRCGIFLFTLIALSLCAFAQSTPEYVKTSDAGPHGSAPGIKVKLLNESGGQRDFAVVFQPGDEFFAGLTQFAEEYHVQSAHLTAVGGLHDARLAWYDESKKAYRVIPVDQQSEVDSLVGDIALLNGKPSVHMHCVVSLEDGTTRGGHVLGGHVSPLLEVWVTVDPTPLLKKHDEKTGLNLMDPDAKP